MADNRTKAQRSYNMSRIHSKDTKPELIVRKFLYANGIRYRLHQKDLPGHPDIVVSKVSIVVFIHGCFWHSHKNCRFAKIPATNKSFWADKIFKNIARDKRNITDLKKAGWTVLTIWECQLTNNNRDATLKRVRNRIINENLSN